MNQSQQIQQFRALVRQQIIDLLSDGREYRPMEISDRLGHSLTLVIQSLKVLLELGQVSRSEKTDRTRTKYNSPIVLYRITQR